MNAVLKLLVIVLYGINACRYTGATHHVIHPGNSHAAFAISFTPASVFPHRRPQVANLNRAELLCKRTCLSCGVYNLIRCFFVCFCCPELCDILIIFNAFRCLSNKQQTQFYYFFNILHGYWYQPTSFYLLDRFTD